MKTLTIPITTYSVQAVHPKRRYGQLARLPMNYNASAVYFRAPLGRIPDGSTVTSVDVRFNERSDESGSRTVKLQPVTTKWDSNVTWDNQPTSSGAIVSVTKSSPQQGDAWHFTGSDMVAAVQQVASGSRTDHGWHMWADPGNSNEILLGGSSGAKWQPVLIVTYTTRPLEPENLHPAGGSVSVGSPVLTFDAVEDILSLQVQVDPAMNGTTPAFDSGTKAAAAGLLDLSTTTYGGLAAGSTTYWRARQQTGGGWSDWSDWVSMSRLAMPTLTITSPPGSTTDDGTPPITWLFSGTQVAWEARLLDNQGRVIDESGYTPGTDTAWTPTKGLKRDGQVGTVELIAWDDQERVATSGAPEYAMVTKTLTYTLDDTVDPVAYLEVVQSGPDVILRGTAQATPDEVDVFRDGDRIARYDGPDVFSGTAFSITDPMPPVGKELQYRVAPRTNGATAAGGPRRTITPFITGIWLADSESPTDRVLLYTDGNDGVPDSTQPELSIVHSPIAGGDDLGSVVRRKMVRYREQGTVTGVVLDPPLAELGAPDAAASEALLRSWAEFDAGHRFRLAFSGWSGDVIIGDVEFAERDNPRQETSRELGVKFNYWGQAPA